jgi:uncharacterized protein YggE
LATVLLAAPLRAEEPGTVTAHATARDRLANTVADVLLGIEAHGRTLAEVQGALSAGSAKLDAFLTGAGAERTRTEAVQVQPDLDTSTPRGQPPRIVGYSGQIAVVFQVAPDKLGTLLGGALGNGANAVNGTALHPRAEELDAARRRLATEATRTALEQAGAVAEAAGRRLGAARSIIVDPVPGFAPRPGLMRAAAAPVATEAGDSEISASVTVTMALIEP